jgi:PKD repeat protein
MNFRPTKTSRTPVRAALLCATLACALLLGTASGVGAYVVQTGGGHFLGIAPKAAAGLVPALQALRVTPQLGARATPAGAAPSATLRANRNAGIPPGRYDVTAGNNGVGFVDTSAYPPDANGGNANGCTPASTTLGPTDPPYVHCLTDAQVQSEVENVISTHTGLPTDSSAIYFVMLPPGIDECNGPGAESTTNACADTDFCAYHSSVNTSSGPLYAVQPYADIQGCTTPQSPNSNPAADDLISVLSHEHNETISDPFGTGWLTALGDEVGDLCAAPDVFGASLGGSSGHEFNQLIGTGQYYLQDEYADTDGSNLAFDGCQQRPGAANNGFAIPSPPGTPDPGPLLYQGGDVIGKHTTYTIYWGPSSGPNAFPANYQTTIDGFLNDVAAASRDHTRTGNNLNVYDTVAQYGTLTQPTAAFTAPPTANPGQPVTFDASASNDPQGFSLTYAWDFGDGITTSTTQPTVAHAYTQTGSHIVTLTVSDQFGGTSQPATHTIHIVVPPTASFSVPSGQLLTGQPITFDGSASGGPDAPITAYSWSFGDGATATGARPSHAYAAANFYSVTLTVSDANGNTGSATQQVAVATNPNPPNRTNRTLAAQIVRSGPAKAILVKGKVVVLTGTSVRCPTGASRCTTKAALTTRVLTRASRGHKARSRTVTIGTATIATAGGHSSVVSVRLNRQGTSLLRRLRHLTVAARISATGSGVQSAASTLTFKISQPAAARRRKR